MELDFENLSAPISVDWNVTDRCNLKCMHCYNGDLVKSSEMSTAEALKFMDNLAESKVLEMTITGGEPFLRKDICDIIKRASDNLIKVQIASNGTVITREVLEKIKNDVARIQLSIDGIESAHDSFRGVQGAFDNVVKAAKLVTEMKIPLVIATVVSKRNINNLQDITDLCKDVGAEAQRLVPIKVIGNAAKNIFDLKLSIDDLKKLVNFTKQNEGFVFSGRSYGFLFDSSLQPKRCTALLTICGVTADGFMIPCIELNSKVFYLGNVKEQLVKDLWNSNKADNIRKQLKLVGGKCLKCNFENTCKGGCKASTFFVSKCFNCADPSCPKGELK